MLNKNGLRHHGNHIRRLSKKSIQLGLILIGASLVSLVSIIFAYLADLAIDWQKDLTHDRPWLPWLMLPLGLPILRFLVQKIAPYSVGSGIPQIIASLSLNSETHGFKRLLSIFQAMCKIPFTFLALFLGASVGREGPSVQVGAAVMYGWGRLCQKWRLPLQGFRTQEWVTAGAAGGLAAAFNAPLAGAIFAIEELGKGMHIMWQRVVMLGVLTSGFLVIAIVGKNPYFGSFNGQPLDQDMFWWMLLCGAVCGIAGGIFARLLSKGYAYFTPSIFRGFVRRHPYIVAAIFGLVIAAIGALTHGTSFGTSYNVAKNALDSQPKSLGTSFFGVSKLIATVLSYWCGIAGGIFTPCLTIGAGLGIHISHLFAMAPEHRNIIVLLCMAAFLAGATQAPITSAVIVMEMVGCQPMLFWLMLACIVSSTVAKQICPHAFYHFAGSRFRQIAIEETKAHEAAKAAKEEAQKTPPAAPAGA